jgi:hypothetical protein
MAMGVSNWRVDLAVHGDVWQSRGGNHGDKTRHWLVAVDVNCCDWDQVLTDGVCNWFSKWVYSFPLTFASANLE